MISRVSLFRLQHARKIMTTSDRWTGIPYKHFDVSIPDVGEKELVEIGADNRIKHLSIAQFPENPFPVRGRVHGINLRLMVPLVCRYNGNEIAKPRHIWFLVNSGSPYTCMSAKSIENLVGEGVVRHLYNCAIQDPSTNIECRLSKGHFSEVNLLGMNAVRRLKLSIDIDWYSETFQLIQKVGTGEHCVGFGIENLGIFEFATRDAILFEEHLSTPQVKTICRFYRYFYPNRLVNSTKNELRRNALMEMLRHKISFLQKKKNEFQTDFKESAGRDFSPTAERNPARAKQIFADEKRVVPRYGFNDV